MLPSFVLLSRPVLRYTLCFLLSLLALASRAQQTTIQYLSGTDKDHTVNWDFYCTSGSNSGKWTTIPVPSCWELQGFGTYNYGHVKLAEQADEVGKYKYRFPVDKRWKGQTVKIVFEGSMTDTEVKINGKSAGPLHQGAFYRFSYDITSLLRYGSSNLLEVQVSKKSANLSVNRAERESDFWIFGGIFRPVYLEVAPPVHIDRVAIDADAKGNFNVSVIKRGADNGYRAEAVITKLDGSSVTANWNANTYADTIDVLNATVSNPALWSPEFPNLYKVTVSLKDKQGKLVHTLEKQFGFRTVELRRQDGFYLNGQKVLFKGVNRHSFWPTSGRTLSKEISIGDVTLMKDMNMNAVRMSHYPPDQHFLDVCDSLGLMVIDELTGWQKMYDDTTARRLVKELVIRDVNHPSIVLWANGNEGGFNRTVDKDYHWYDPQKRQVIHPWEKFNGTETKHYPDYNYLVNQSLYEKEVFFPTEFMHGLYDGGHGAALDDFWNLMVQTPRSAGGFLWVFADEAVVRHDKKDSLDSWKNAAPDGIVGPYHEKEGSYYTIKEIWSPVQVATPTLNTGFNGKLRVENRYMFTNLAQCKFVWKLKTEKDGAMSIRDSGIVASVSAAPGNQQWIDLGLPANCQDQDALYLTAYDPGGKEIYTWSWPIHYKAAGNSVKTADHQLKIEEDNSRLIVLDKSGAIHFDKATGYITQVTKGNQVISLSGGPALAGFEQQLTAFKHGKGEGSVEIVEAEYKGKDNWLKIKWTFRPAAPAVLEYSFSQRGEAEFIGITFNYPEEKIKGMKWKGRGPYRVWKNRLKGQQWGIWEKAYNNTVTGESGWEYPEFKGNHADVRWVTIQTTEFPFTVSVSNENLYFQMLKPVSPTGAYNNNTTVNYPAGNIGFLNAIQPIGTKFQAAGAMGPQSQKNTQLNAPFAGTLTFDFGW
ncbi:glycoside hydrolase family 2 TIM barrel-domain containing protein [Paraflavitalea pollutisoli]|uniref:glycoside hydrolase family 2 TIM barrel-domain containing protein n=1 Tax=Paraflavitalea pollutisoli TaxID=3034143 RepID=UPI0023EB5C7C|nr:glycoside hydrolase family 2 TIM barrel-domain containing protein [Paraflavitalea sp. H1-2-19X]